MIQNEQLKKMLNELSCHECVSDFLFVLYGKLDQDITISAIQLIERKMKLEGFSKGMITRTKMISIEILQNIVKHQEKHDRILPYFILGTREHQPTIFSGNVVNEGDREQIITKLNQFIALEKGEIRDKYIDAIENADLSEEGNAGIGLYDIVFRSNKNIKYNIDSLNDNLYTFDLNVSVN
ncbi:MAG: hypothetical protein EP338_08765 [Bacteroidetes bacterium]|nr:MAG: hypothetical protein EP338_08765 [Bacteroidota bacterium]